MLHSNGQPTLMGGETVFQLLATQLMPQMTLDELPEPSSPST